MKTIDNDRLYDVLTVANFLLWLEKNDNQALWGGEKIEDVIKAFSNISGFEETLLRNIVFKNVEE